MKNKMNNRVFSGTAALGILILSALISIGPIQEAKAQQNTTRDDTVMENQSRSGSMERYFDPESGGLDVPHGTDLQVTDLIELSVRNEQGETVGEIEDVIMNRNDTVLAVIAIEEFLGLGEDLVTVPVSELEMGDNYTHVIYSTRRGDLEDRSAYTGGGEYRRLGSSGRDETNRNRARANRFSGNRFAQQDRQDQDRRGSRRNPDNDSRETARSRFSGNYQALVGKTVVNQRGEAIGEVENVLAGGRGKPMRAVVSVGGFLGIGDSEVLVSFDDFRIMPGRNFIRYQGTEDALENEPEYEEWEYREYGYTPRWPYGQPYGYPRAYRYSTRETPPEFRNRYDPYPYRWENYTMYDELPSYDRYGEEGFQRPLGYWDRRTGSARQQRENTRFQESGSYYDPEPEERRESFAIENESGDLIGRKIENEQGIVIGTVEDLMTNRKGAPVAVISVDRFTGGSGEKLIGVPVNDLERDEISGSLRYGASRREIRNQKSISETD